MMPWRFSVALGRRAVSALIALSACAAAAAAGELRIVTYNIDADTASGSNGTGNVSPGLSTVLQGIGTATLGDGSAQPVDVLRWRRCRGWEQARRLLCRRWPTT